MHRPIMKEERLKFLNPERITTTRKALRITQTWFNIIYIMRTVIRTDENRRPVITRIAVTHQFHQLATSMHGRLTPCVVRLDSCPLKAAWQEARCAVSCCSVISPWLRRSGSCITWNIIMPPYMPRCGIICQPCEPEAPQLYPSGYSRLICL